MSLKKYYWIYFGLYLAFSALMAFISSLINIGSGVSIIAPMVAAMSTGQVFIKDHARAPDDTERNQLVWGSLAISWGSSLVVALAALAMMASQGEDITQVLEILTSAKFMLIMAVVLGGVFSISYLMTNWAYGSFSTKSAAKIKKS